MNCSLRFALLLLGFTGIAYAQPVPTELWSRLYATPENGIALALASAPDNGFVVAGQIGTFSAANSDYYILRCNSDGDTLWTRAFGGDPNDVATAITRTADGGYVVAGYYDSGGTGSYDIGVVKIDADGNEVWLRVHGTGYDDGAYAIRELGNGDIAVAGYSYSGGGQSNVDAYLLRLNSVGDTLWTHRYGGPENDGAFALDVVPDGGFILCGISASFGDMSGDGYLLRTDADGNLLWSRTFGGIYEDDFFAVRAIGSDSIVVAGATWLEFGDYDHYDRYILLLEADGDTLWTRRFGLPGYHDVARALIIAQDGNFVLGGYSYSTIGTIEMSLMKVSTGGVNMWSRAYSGGEEDYCFGLMQTAEGNYILAGRSYTEAELWNQIRIVKTGADWTTASPDPSESLLADSYSISAYPNPFNSLTTIRFTLPVTGTVELQVHDISGRLLRTLAKSDYPSGEHQLLFDGSNLSSGIYFLHLASGTFSTSHKLLLLK